MRSHIVKINKAAQEKSAENKPGLMEEILAKATNVEGNYIYIENYLYRQIFNKYKAYRITPKQPTVVKGCCGKSENLEVEVKSELKLPSIGKRIVNLAGAVKTVVNSSLNGEPLLASTEEASIRLSICEKCEFYMKPNNCSKCGCNMPSKVKLKAMKCPLPTPKW